MKKISIAFLSLVLAFACFAMYACQGDVGDETSTDALSEETTQSETETKIETEETQSEQTSASTTETEETVTTEEPCAHDWTEADCNKPATCTLCGEIDGEALGHTGGLAACFKKAVCERCGKEYGKAGGHFYDAMVTTSEYLASGANMTDCAKYYYSCSLCGRKGSKTFEYGENVIDGALKNFLAYKELSGDNSDTDSFLYFTDPHYIEAGTNAIWKSAYTKHLSIMGQFYDAADVSFAMCGGDWLHDTNSKESAINILGSIKSKMAENFDRFCLVVGNHDYNYQTKDDMGQITWSPDRFTPEELADIWFEEYGSTYYTFESTSTKFYIFDTGTDWQHNKTSLNDCCHEQINWFLSELEANDDAHIALAPHMFIVTKDIIHPAVVEYTKISKVYNERGTYTFDGKTYDFSEKSGRVEFLISGHAHYDSVTELNGIPVVITSLAMTSSFPTFDMIYIDYDAAKLYAVRVGTGVDRVVDLVKSDDE